MRIYGISGATPGKSDEAVCLGCQKVVGVGTREQILPLLVQHYQSDHGGVPDVLLEGADGHFTTHLAPTRCDLCGIPAERPWWVCLTDQVPGEYTTEDPEWLVCDDCYPLVQARDVMGLMKRYLRITLEQYAATRSEARELGLELLPAFLSHVDLARSYRED